MPYFTYSFDPMMRPAGMTDQSGASVVSGVLYGPANELTQMTYNGGTETRQYNSMLQLTSISGLGQSINYTFPAAGSNAGKIVSQTDIISGETVNYLYDSLNRLTSARAATNQLSGYTYDLNGNQISTGYAYDAENRLVQVNAGAVKYAYDGQNKRIWQATFSNCGGDSCMSSELISIFGIDGKLVGSFTAGAAWNNTQTQIPLSFYSATQRIYFGKKLVATLDWQGNQNGVVQDRLESVGKYYPFGEERNSPPLANDQVKFSTYTRDSATGLDYADQRYYSSTFGRFMGPDPYLGSSNPRNPGSWNRYAYVEGDPVNYTDPDGLQALCGSDWISDASLSGPCRNEIYAYLNFIGPIGGSSDRAYDYQYSVAQDLLASGLITDWDFHNNSLGSFDITLNGDYAAFFTYLQQCGCQTIGSVISQTYSNTQLIVGVAVALALDMIFKKSPEWVRTPVTGTPDSVRTFPAASGKTVRVYGPDGRAIRDIDYGDQAHSGNDPEVHDWNWSSGKPVRDPIGRAPKPGEIP